MLLARPLSAVTTPERALLETHSENVAEELAAGIGANPPVLRRFIGAYHDFGKATAFFQEYVRDERDRSKVTNHGYFSALAAFFALDRYGFGRIERAIAWYVIARHHGPMLDIDELYSRAFTSEQLSRYKTQARALRPYADAIRCVYDSIDPGMAFDVSDFVDWIESNEVYKDVTGALEYRGSVHPDDLPVDSAYEVIEAYGQLIGTDRLDASEFEVPDRRTLSGRLVDEYVEQTFDSPAPGSLNALREAGRQTVERTILENGPETHRYTLTLPTGLGKTLTGLHAALLLRNMVRERMNAVPRIIYALPYTSIIDQNHDVFTDVYETATGAPATPEVALKHHHLSTGYHGDTDLELTYEKASLLEDRWESEIVTTTYVQLLEGLLTPSPSQSIRMPAFKDAIIVLDEPQSIPTKYWELVDDTLSWMAEAWNAYVISMTATQPRVTDESGTDHRSFVGGTSLLPGRKYFYDRLDRVQFRFDDSVESNSRGLTIDDFVGRIRARAVDDASLDILCVANTIRTAQEVHERVSSASWLTNTDEIVYLSSNVRPVDREARLSAIKEESENRTIVVSTQVVETGVDIDLDYVLRDFAPLDTIVQAAGRCNRNSLEGKHVVEIVQLHSPRQGDDLQAPCAQVYDVHKLDATRDAIEGEGTSGVVSESTMFEAMLPTYFDHLPRQVQLDQNRDEIQAWEFDSGSISLIETSSFDVFVRRSREDSIIRDQFITAISNDDQDTLMSVKPTFYQRVVSVRRDQLNVDEFRESADCLSEERDLYAINLQEDERSRWYEDPIGFRV